MLVLRRMGVVTAVLALAAVAADARAQGIAAVTTCKGEVSVLEAATRTPRPVTVLPDTGRVSGGALAVGDEVRTGPGATAVVQFPDGSAFRLEPSTRLAVSESPMAAHRPGDKSVRRQLRLDEGRVACDVKPSDAVYTAIRSPAGLVGVRGTTFTVAFAAGRFHVSVDGGQVFLLDPSGSSAFPVGSGQQLELQIDDAGAVVARITADAGRSVSASIGDARVQLDAGDVIRIAPGADGALAITVVAGPVQVTRGGSTQSLATGASFAAQGEAAAAAAAPADAPADSPKPADAKPVAAPSPDEIPALPAVRVVADTLEASPMR
jgi:ferric-dicitrate binding protein FerR (iron transport regulator)